VGARCDSQPNAVCGEEPHQLVAICLCHQEHGRTGVNSRSCTDAICWEDRDMDGALSMTYMLHGCQKSINFLNKKGAGRSPHLSHLNSAMVLAVGVCRFC
jgi:hypothetical protein